MKKIALVNVNSFGTYFPKYINQLENIVGEVRRFKFDPSIGPEELNTNLKGYNYIVTGTTPQFTEVFFSKNASVEYIARFGVGYNNVDVVSARKKGVMVSNIPSCFEKNDVAEHAVALGLDVLKNTQSGLKAVLADEWNFERVRFLGHRVANKTVGIIGLGEIGRTFANIMQSGFHCRVIAADPFLDEKIFVKQGVEQCELEELLMRSDIVSLHANLTEQNYHMIDQQKIALMKTNAVLINTARGELVDEDSLAEALNNHHIFGYGADVIENEPPAQDNPLLTSKNTIITPHIATYNYECNEEMCNSVVEDIITVYSGNKPKKLLEK